MTARLRLRTASALVAVGACWSAPLAHGDRWVSAAPMSSGRIQHTATPLSDGRVLVLGGADNSYPRYARALASAEIYDPASASWTPVAPMSAGRVGQTATRLADGRVLVVGGTSSGSSPAEVYDPATNVWTATAAGLAPQSGSTATLLHSGKVLVTGTVSAPGAGPGYAELYDPATNAWTPAAPMMLARTGHSATLLRDGRVLVAGGMSGENAVTSAELYDPAANTWRPAGSMHLPRTGQTAVRLQNGQVLISGGASTATCPHACSSYPFLCPAPPAGCLGPVDSAEIYDPGTDSWSLAAPMITARENQTATLLHDGDVVVTGGDHWVFAADGSVTTGGPLRSVEVYDPNADTWTMAAHMRTARNAHTATLLRNGRVLIAGGPSDTAAVLSSTELYNPLPRPDRRQRHRKAARHRRGRRHRAGRRGRRGGH